MPPYHFPDSVLSVARVIVWRMLQIELYTGSIKYYYDRIQHSEKYLRRQFCKRRMIAPDNRRIAAIIFSTTIIR